MEGSVCVWDGMCFYIMTRSEGLGHKERTMGQGYGVKVKGVHIEREIREM